MNIRYESNFDTSVIKCDNIYTRFDILMSFYIFKLSPNTATKKNEKYQLYLQTSRHILPKPLQNVYTLKND